MEARIITNEEFDEILKRLENISSQITENNNPISLSEKWLDNQEVCMALKISKRTLQNYRDNGTLPFSQFGGKIYYKASDIEDHLNKHYKKAS